MPHRRFADSKGKAWEVWDVDASRAERAREKDNVPEPQGLDRRATKDRARIHLHGEFSKAWLCFEGKDDKRRLAPPPSGWEKLDEAGLERLLDAAKPVGRSQRVLE